VFFGYGALVQPNNTSTTTPTLVDFSTTTFGYIKNPYFGVVVGLGGTFGVSWPNGTSTLTATHNVAGMLSFGNVNGSSRFSTDNLQALNGFEFNSEPYEEYGTNGVPLGYGVWPLASWWEITAGGGIIYEYSAYTRIQIDGTITNVMGSSGFVNDPQFVNNVLTTQYAPTTAINVVQSVKLYRTLAQLHWHVTNTDTAAHSVRLRFTVNVRPNAAQTFNLGGDNSRTGFYFDDGNGLISDSAVDLTGSNIPTQLTIYGKRYQVDSTTDPPFAARHIFRKFNATVPDAVVIAHPIELRPNAGGMFLGPLGDTPFVHPKLSDGVATGIVFGPAAGHVIPPGGSWDVYTYYGNGSPDDLPNDDFTISADGPESLAYNAAAVNNPGIAGNSNLNPSVAIPQFLLPNPITIYGSIYNQVPSSPSTSVNLNNVQLSLTLPTGLTFGTNPTTNATDVAVKSVGTVPSDSGNDVSWTVVPTGSAFGTQAYVLNVSSNELQSRQITRAISIPATPFKTVSADSFQMIGFPFDFDPLTSNNADPATVVNGLTSPADSPVVFYTYAPDPNDPNGFGQYNVVSQLSNGIGYMYRPNLNRTIYAKGVLPLAGQAATGLTNFNSNTQRQISLPKGWNIISNPYLYEIALGSLQFATPTQNGSVSSVTLQNYASAVSSGLIQGSLFYLDLTTNGYDYFSDATELLEPWQGYWIFCNDPVILVYSLPTEQQSAILPGPDPEPPTRGVIASGKAVVANPTMDNWKLQLVAHQGTKNTDGATIIGVNTDPTIKASTRSTPKPPVAVSDYVYAAIVKSNTSSTRLASDVRATGGTNQWQIDVTSDKSGPVTITWPNIATLPRRVSLVAKDQTTGRAYAMRSSSSITLNLTAGKASRLVVTSKQQSAQPLQVTILATMGASRATGGRSFTYNLSREASVTGYIKTITGNTIATLAVSRAASSGVNTLSWNGRAQNGTLLPPGPYRIEIMAQGPDGETTTASGPFMTLQ
jgi:hypothetical protein